MILDRVYSAIPVFNMNTKTDEILYLDEIHDEVSKPLTASITNLDAIPSIHTRAGFASDNAESEAGDLDEKLKDGTPSAPPLGFQSRNGPDEPPGLLPNQPIFSSNVTLATPDVNVYQHKKTLAQGMMDLALLSANANQMRYILQTDGRHPYFYPSLTMISMSLLLQIAVGIGLIWNSVYNVKEHEQMCKANKANNWTVIGIFLVTILNVFISSFNVVDEVPGIATAVAT